MPNFEVGDRFRFIENNPDGGDRYGRVGEIGIVDSALEFADDFGQGPEIMFKFEDPVRLEEVGGDPYFVPIRCIELIEPDNQPEIQQLVRYAVVSQYRDELGPSVCFYGDQNTAERVTRNTRRNGGIVLATKKITLQVPVIVFPELQVDEDDNIIEEEEQDD